MYIYIYICIYVHVKEILSESVFLSIMCVSYFIVRCINGGSVYGKSCETVAKPTRLWRVARQRLELI